MNANSDNFERSYSKQLMDFAEQLQKDIDDETLLDDIQAAIESLLSGDENVEVDIRRILQEQQKAGHIRDETVELVERMLDRIISGDFATSPSASETPVQVDDPFRDTTVIEAFTLNDESADERLQVGSVLRDRFLLQERVAGGSMGVVYKALDRRLAEAEAIDPFVAIKVLTPQLSKNGQALRALQQEAAKGRCLSHPNIVRFLDLDRDDDLYFIVMEWLHGRSLSSILDENTSKNIDKDTALDIVKQVAKALDYAHLRGVVHADVKPGNIIVSPDGVVKLFDFGVARVRQKQADDRAHVDPALLRAVTPAYSSMQVLTGEEPVASDDVFSLGCLTYRLIAGYRVFGPRNAAEASEEGMEPQRPQGLNDTEWHALRKALSFSRVSRFASAKDFVKALAGPALPESTQEVMDIGEADDARRRIWPYIVTVVALIVGVLGLYQFGLLDRLLADFMPGAPVTVDKSTMTEQAQPVEASIEEVQSTDDRIIDDQSVENQTAEDQTAEDQDILFEDEIPIVELADDEVQTLEPGPQAELIDFSTLPPATIEVPLAFPGTVRTEVDLILREDEEPAIVDLVRKSSFADTLVVRLEEVSFSGNRSPWESGQYQISGDSTVRFLPGQDRVRFTVSMTPDPLREPDRQASLLVRDYDNAQSEFALLNLSLEDDDQRRFESGLGQNTVAFAVGQVSVRERDPAVQIDVVRFNPDQTSLTVGYVLRDVTASDGEDYFAPGVNSVQFGPGQRSARILIPLVQDSIPESDEAFVLEMLDLQPDATNANIFRRIAVMIRDDDSNLE